MGSQTLEFKRILEVETFHKAMSNLHIRKLLQNTYKILCSVDRASRYNLCK